MTRSDRTELGATSVGFDHRHPLLDLAPAFPALPEDIWLEIGFGSGEHLLHEARSHPQVGFLGVEAFVNGVAKLLAVVDAEGLPNIRLWDDDVSSLLPRLPGRSIGRAFVLYPDPWPKRRQRKRRLVDVETLGELARVLRPGAELRFATDIDDYAGWVLARVARSPDWTWLSASSRDWNVPWENWPGTRYEQKALREGRKPIYLTFRRTRDGAVSQSAS